MTHAGQAGFRNHEIDFWARARLGLVPGFTPVFFRGRNPNIDTSGARSFPIDVWPAPGDVRDYPFLSAAASLQIVSTSAADAVSGTGARVALVRGLDASWNEVVEAVAMSGTTPAPVATQMLRVNDVIVATAGTGLTNAGTLSLSTVGGTVLAQIAPGDGSSFSGVYSVPVGYRLLITDYNGSVQRSAAAAAAEVSFMLRDARNSGAWFEPISVGLHTQGTTDARGEVYAAAIAGGFDTRFRCKYVSNSGTQLTVAMSGFLYLDQ